MIDLSVNIPAQPAFIWDKLTANEHLSKWWAEGVTLEAKLGGKFYEPWTDRKGKRHITLGYVTDFETNPRLQMNWQEAGWAKGTRVEFVLRPNDNGTQVTLLHSGWDMFSDEAARNKIVQDYNKIWNELLEELREYCFECMNK